MQCDLQDLQFSMGQAFAQDKLHIGSNKQYPSLCDETCSSDGFPRAGFDCTGYCMFPKERRVTLGNSRMPQARKDAAMAMENDVLRWSAPPTQGIRNDRCAITKHRPSSFPSTRPVQASRMLQLWRWTLALYQLYRQRHAPNVYASKCC